MFSTGELCLSFVMYSFKPSKQTKILKRYVMSLSISVKCKYKECISGFLLSHSHSLICFLFSKYDILILYINSLLKSGDISGFYIASTV